MRKPKLNRNNLFVTLDPPLLQFIERETGKLVEVKLLCDDSAKKRLTKSEKLQLLDFAKFIAEKA